MVEFKSVENWLGRMGDTTARNHRINFWVWMAWMKENGGAFKDMNPDELVEYQRDAETNRQRYEILDVAQKYIHGLEGKRLNTAKRYYSMIRSFFAHNRAELPKDPTFIIRSDVEKVRGTLTIEQVRDVIIGSKPLYRAVFLSIFQGGMGLEEFSHWNKDGLDSLTEQLKNSPKLVRIDLPGRKAKKNDNPYHTYIGGDAIKAIRDYLRIRPEGGDAIFLNQTGGPVQPKTASMYWNRHLLKLSLIEPTPEKLGAARYGKNIHELRDVFRSQWEMSPAKPSVAEYIMGHQVDPLDYNKAHRNEAWIRGEYLRALPHLQVMSSARPFGLVPISEEADMAQSRFFRLLEDPEFRASFTAWMESQTREK